MQLYSSVEKFRLLRIYKFDSYNVLPCIFNAVKKLAPIFRHVALHMVVVGKNYLDSTFKKSLLDKLNNTINPFDTVGTI